MLSANDPHRMSRRSMVSSSSHSLAAEPVARIFKVLESEDEYLNARNSVAKEKPAVEEQQRQQAPPPPQVDTKGRPIATAPTTSSAPPPAPPQPNACCFIYVSPSLCPPNAQTVSAAQETSERGDAENIDFYVCDVASALGQQIATKYDKPGSLPAFAFYFGGNLLEGYSGDSVDKFKICCKAALAKRQHAIKQKEKDDADKAASTSQ